MRAKFYGLISFFTVVFFIFSFAIAQDAPPEEQKMPAQEASEEQSVLPGGMPEEQKVPAQAEGQLPAKEAAAPQDETVVVEPIAGSQNVTLDFKDADIRNVLKIISYKSGVNIVTTPEVIGNVTIRLVDVPWEKALEVILKTYGFAYDRVGEIITVAPLEKLTTLKKQEVELSQVQPTITEVFNLKYIDAQDAKKALEPQLSPRGKITVLEMTGQAGWEFGAVEITKRRRTGEEKMARSKVLIISDIPPVLDNIKEVVAQLDIMPPQILVEARIMEVNTDRLKDLGVDWGTGTTGASTETPGNIASSKHDGISTSTIAAHAVSGLITPSVFASKSSGLTAANTGLKLIYKKLTGSQFEVVLHALEEDARTNTLSAPRLLALNNQEASILIGTKYPILTSDVSSQSAGQTVSVSLEYYQDIGIQLNVVPQVGANNYINMVVHPAVSTTTATGTSISTGSYPIIDIREAETRVLMKDGETVVIGGLLKDVKGKQITGIPILSKIPLLGKLFSRETLDTQKIELIIFITAHIIREGEFSPEEIAKMEEPFKNMDPVEDTKKKKKL